jgi:hypothetical protein
MAGRDSQVNSHIDRTSNEVARLLDSGKGVQAADLLRDEARNPNMTAKEYNTLVKRAERRDDKQYGDNLSIVPGEGLIIIDGRKGEILVGRLADERQRRPEPPNHGRRDDSCNTNGAVGEGALKGGGLGAIAGGLIKGNREGMAIGGVLGAIGGAIYGNETAKSECEDNQRPPTRRR